MTHWKFCEPGILGAWAASSTFGIGVWLLLVLRFRQQQKYTTSATKSSVTTTPPTAAPAISPTFVFFFAEPEELLDGDPIISGLSSYLHISQTCAFISCSYLKPLIDITIGRIGTRNSNKWERIFWQIHILWLYNLNLCKQELKAVNYITWSLNRCCCHSNLEEVGNWSYCSVCTCKSRSKNIKADLRIVELKIRLESQHQAKYRSRVTQG